MSAGIAQRGRTPTIGVGGVGGVGGARPKIVRCAIYTRKSSDEGLEQAFNSLDAQREACAAYVLSQASEGWTLLPDIYDDGGLSGGTLERPALKRLLGEVAAGRVDIIVVYKVDRLTRSLFDFAKLVETFDAAGTSFVSVTQSFNTTTSMGRLTLNMLLSFAQFEREVTAERIRDKIAASKAKGMWMGGTPPLGYAPDGRSLAIVEEHAALVRHVYQRYLALGSVRTLQVELQDEGRTLPVRPRLNGNGSIGGGAFTRGQLYKLLSNPVYVGRIAHGSVHHPGRHPAIIDETTWEAVQARLADNRQGARLGTRAASPSLLAGLVTDERGEPLISSHATNKGRRYRYYQSRPFHGGSDADAPRIRMPASDLEAAVTARMIDAFDDPFALASEIGLVIAAATTAMLMRRAEEAAQQLGNRNRSVVRALIARVRVYRNSVEIDCDTAALADMFGAERTADAADTITFTAPVTLARTGRALRLVHEGGASVTANANANASLIKLLLKARGWWRILREGEFDIKALAAAEGVQASYVTRVVRLAFLSPAVVQAILGGTLRAGVDAKALTLGETIPAYWKAQAAMLLPVAGNSAI